MSIGLEEQKNEKALRRSVHTAFVRLHQQGLYGQWLARLYGRPCTLLNLADSQTQQPVQARMHGGVKVMPLNRICGSEGRCHDFDTQFRPLKEFNQERWVSVACAQLSDVTLPLVELIQVNDLYYVRDGHHRISVAYWLGQKEIDAEVTVWRSHTLDAQTESHVPTAPTATRLPEQVKALSTSVAKIGEWLLATVAQKVQPLVGRALTQGS